MHYKSRFPEQSYLSRIPAYNYSITYSLIVSVLSDEVPTIIAKSRMPYLKIVRERYPIFHLS